MIDLHVHMLWDWDDGPDEWIQSLRMIRIAERDGVSAIALTPHVFRRNRYANDLGVLRQRMIDFRNEMSGLSMEFHFGAEVFVNAETVKIVEKYRFTIDSTNYERIKQTGNLICFTKQVSVKILPGLNPLMRIYLHF